MTSRQMAFCGLLVALAVVAMVLAGTISIGTFAGPVLAMAVLLPLLEEYGIKTAATAYVSTAILGILLVPEPELSMVYAAFGWYPLLRPKLNRIPTRLPRLTVKVFLCAAVILLLYGILLRLLGLTANLMNASLPFNLLLLILGIVTFLIMDLALERLTVLWHKTVRRRLLH